MLLREDSYQILIDQFKWHIPQRYNIAWDICDKWIEEVDRTALVYETGDGIPKRYTFKDIHRLSNQLANVFNAFGLDRLDRIGVLLPQRPEVAVTHLAAYRSGAIAVPLFTLFGQDALRYRLRDSGAKFVVTDSVGVNSIAVIRHELPDLQVVFNVDGDGDGVPDCADAFPSDDSETTDNDSDGTGDNADLDSDGDGINDCLLYTSPSPRDRG